MKVADLTELPPLAPFFDHGVGGEEDASVSRRPTTERVQPCVCSKHTEVCVIQTGLFHDGLDLILPSDTHEGGDIGVSGGGEKCSEEADDGGGLPDARIEAREVDGWRTSPLGHRLHDVGHGAEGVPHHGRRDMTTLSEGVLQGIDGLGG
jgi:hypothetical protein